MNNVTLLTNRISILDADATQISEWIRTKEFSVVEITETYIEHIKEKQPVINFMTEDRFEEALREAKDADHKMANREAKGRLFGVPISMKESFDVEGMRTTGGLIRRKNKIINKDAVVVSKLKAEGAIILSKSNTPELCFCQETDNKLYGRTNNPWNVKRTAGGSSGGEGAAIAAGCAAAGLGSDIGGSIRFPSHFNGVIGFKSGNGQVSQTGSYPFVENDWQQRMLGIGPIAKSVRDAKLIYEIISGRELLKKHLTNYTINVFRTTEYPISNKTTLLLNAIYVNLKRKFHTERELVPLLSESALLWQEIMSIDGGNSTKQDAFGREEGNPYGEYVKELIKGTSKIHRYLSWAMIGASLFKPSAKRVEEMRRALREGDELLDTYLDNRLLILPVYHSAAPLHGKVYKEIFSIRKTYQDYMPFTAYANTWGLPALTVPIGKDHDGMPIGLQIIGKIGQEDAVFSLGEYIEKEFGGYSRAK